MWRLLELLIAGLIVIVFISEFLIPLLMNKPLFGSFRKTKPEPKKDSTREVLEDALKVAKEKVEEVKKVQSDVSDHYKSAEQLKRESDNLLNNKK
jgi:uncharacterized protein YktB (UPF0637 family)